MIKQSVPRTTSPVAAGTIVGIVAWSLRHRRWIVGSWLLLAVAGFATLSVTSSRLSSTFDLPGQPAFVANQAIQSTYGNGGDTPPLLAVTTLPRSTTIEAAVPGLTALNTRITEAAPGARILSYATTGNRALVAPDGRTIVTLIYPKIAPGPDPYVRATPALVTGLKNVTVASQPVHLTGQTILANGGSNGGGNSILVETLLAGLGALVVLAIVFGSLLGLLPLFIATVAIPTTFLGILAFSEVTTMSVLTENIVALIGLGIGIDYSLLIVTRWREERARNADNRQAILQAAATAGESVLFSGTTVTVSLAALVLTPVPFLRSFGIAGALIALISVAIALTLLPIILDTLGPRLEWPRRKPAKTRSRFWARTAEAVARHPLLAAVAAVIVLATAIAPLAYIRLGEPAATSVAVTAPPDARAGIDALHTSGFGTGVLRPVEILTTQPSETANAVSTISGVATLTAGTLAGHASLQDAWTVSDSSSNPARTARQAIRSSLDHAQSTRVGGSATQDDDEIHALYGPNALIVLAAVILLTFLLLARALRSLWLPLKALALNVISLAAAYGVVTFIWQDGHGSQALLGSPATGSITIWVPLAVFALLFGLSMDYEVFILTRIREEYLKSNDTKKAVIEGVSRTGKLVTSGALILFLAFVALGGVPVTDVKVLSTALAAGIIIDATVIRGLLAPALVVLLDKANWYFPSLLARLLRENDS